MAAALAPVFALQRNAALVLADGTVFWGYGIGAEGVIAGELCFTTGMSGYQETLTDPSFAGQIITFTFPHIGNVGCNSEDIESRVESRESSKQKATLDSSHSTLATHLGACGLIIREAITEPSNFRSTQHLNDWLIARDITGISGIDTRMLTAHLREHGAQNGAIVFESRESRVESRVEKGKSALASVPDMNGLELAANASRSAVEEWSQGLWSLEQGYHADDTALSTSPNRGEPARDASYSSVTSPNRGEPARDASYSSVTSPNRGEDGRGASNAQSFETSPPPHLPPTGGGIKDSFHIIAIDYGMKHNIARNLASLGCRVTMLPAKTLPKEILALKPDGVFLSNGPGDPAATGNYAVPVIQEIIASGIPVFGICLGHQLLAIALGAKTEKMTQGHRGANHPIKNLVTGKVEITAQNHGFAVSKDGLPNDVEVTHMSLFDGTIAGLRHKAKPVFSVQYHPESSPGPHDSRYLFSQFVAEMKKSRESRVKSRVEGKIA